MMGAVVVCALWSQSQQPWRRFRHSDESEMLEVTEHGLETSEGPGRREATGLMQADLQEI